MPFAPPEGTELLDALGAGGIFDVAVVREAGITLICKRLSTRARREPVGRAAMVREAKVLALARHAALPTLVRVGTDAHGPFLLETRADGVSMRELVQGWRYRKRAVPAKLVQHIASTAIEALAEIQRLETEAGPLELVHGDIGPDHLVLGPLGQIRLVDLGAARWRGMDEELEARDRGTLPYVAPEVARDEVAPDAAGDVYALAATLLFVATGAPPCEAKEEGAMLAEIGERGIAPERVLAAEAFTPAQREALAAALRAERSARPGSIAALAAAF